MTNENKLAVAVGGSFLAGGLFKGWLDRREERRERDRLERKELRERLREQQEMTERLERRLEELNVAKG